nr:hypothetical protein [uncultured Flavobacterium sp.]
MKNKIDFLRYQAIPKSITLTCDHYEEAEEFNRKKSIKLIKGKVKIYKKTVSPKSAAKEYFEDDLELNVISKRMSLFLKITFIFIMISTLLLLLKKAS